MAKRILLPVFPSEAFYDAVVATGDLLAAEGGLVTFLFTVTRPPESIYESDGDGKPSEVDISEDAVDADGRDLERWRELQVQGLEEARGLLRERGIGRDRVDYAFADQADHESPAEAIADEAAAGAYDIVVLARGYFSREVDDGGSAPDEVARAIEALGEVKLLVT
jgi:hypothetical protein